MGIHNNLVNTESFGELNQDDHGRVLPRKSVLWRAFINIKGHRFSCQIRNLSAGGMKIKLDIPFKNDVEAIVEISKLNVSLRAKIAWQSDGFFGLRFIEDHVVVREQFSDGAAIVGVDVANLLGALD